MVAPRVRLVPAGDGELGDRAVELNARAGLVLDDWQEDVLRASLLRTGDGWAAFEVGVVVPRQNGKGSILEARELAGLFLLEGQHIIHSAHETMTALEHFYRVDALIDRCKELRGQVKSVRRTNGREAIWLRNGNRLEFQTRTKGRGRGFSSDTLIFDEAMFLPEHAIAAAFFTLSARPDPQVWYTGSSPDQLVDEHGVALARVRERALRQDTGLAYFEWSLPIDNPDLVDDDVAADPEQWRQANPALGIRISEEHVEAERRSVAPRTFAVERLCVGDWPPTSGDSVIDLEAWNALIDPASVVAGEVAFTFDVKPDRSASSIAAAGRRSDGMFHVEVIDRRRGTNWVVPRILELVGRHANSGVFCDSAGPAVSLVAALAGELEVQELSAREMANACGLFYDAVEDEQVRHLGTPELTAALRGAQKRALGDAWAWSRKNSAVDISPLVAVTVALWAVSTARTTEVFAGVW